EGIARGKIDLVLSGFKLNGRYGLVRLAKSDNEWLLLKKRDQFSHEEGDLLSEAPRSILSGMTVEELYVKHEIAGRLEARAESLGACRQALDVAGLEPMRCALEGAELKDAAR